MISSVFELRSFADLPGWLTGDHASALAAFQRSAGRFKEAGFKTGTLGIEGTSFAAAVDAALAAGPLTGDAARIFFETHFQPAFVRPATASGRGFVTGYYEPEVDASPVQDGPFQFPLYARPDDLVEVDDVSRPAGLDPYFRFARRREDGLLDEYPDRQAIENGFLRGRGLEIAWLADPVEAFFIHVQGSARLRYPDHRLVRVTYAAKTGHPFTAVGRILVEEGELTLAEADMDGIRAWLKAHPDRVRPLLNRNRSFIFFREVSIPDERMGPVGAAKVPLSALASIAVDRELQTFGTPFFLSAPDLLIEGKPFQRLTIAQDTGSAILGAARADIFIGSGGKAGEIAGRVRHPADFFALLPKALVQGAPQ